MSITYNNETFTAKTYQNEPEPGISTQQNILQKCQITFLFLSGGKNIGKTALKNQVMELLRSHVIRHDKVKTFEKMLVNED